MRIFALLCLIVLFFTVIAAFTRPGDTALMRAVHDARTDCIRPADTARSCLPEPDGALPHVAMSIYPLYARARVDFKGGVTLICTGAFNRFVCQAEAG